MTEPSKTTKLTDVLSYRLNVLSRAIDSNAELNSMRHINMTLLETRVTHYLYENGKRPVIAIARDMCVDAGQISRMVVSLIEKGHVERTPNPADGRSTIISLTGSGRESVAKRIRSVLRWNEILAGQLTGQEYQALCGALDKLTNFVRTPSDDELGESAGGRREAASAKAREKKAARSGRAGRPRG